jgi:hypothetical protein
MLRCFSINSFAKIGGAVALVVGLLPFAAAAGSASPAFDEAQLMRVQQRYTPGILENFREVILPRLEPDDATALRDVTIEFPLRVEGAEPFAFFTSGGKITMSAASILFLDELATAAGWLNAHGYAQNSVTDYASMLKYGKLGDHPPSPLKALCIPENAMEDAKTKSTADEGFNVAAIFVLLHELGHVLHRHPGYENIAPEAARANEAEADRFALDGLRRLNATPLAMIQYFTVMAHMAQNRGDFASQEAFNAYLGARTHPLDSGRIAQLAESLKQEPGMAALAGQILEQITGTLEREGVQSIMSVIGDTGLEANLAPRRANEKLGTPCGWVDDGQDFSGPYDGTMMINGVEFDVSLILSRSGSSVRGASSFGVATYSVDGEIDGGTMFYRWFAGDVSGNAVLNLAPDRTLSGMWASKDSPEDGGAVALRRREAK